MLALDHHAVPRRGLVGEDLAHQGPARGGQVRAGAGGQPGGMRSRIGIGVDLPVRVVQGHPDLLPTVLEGEDVADPDHCRERLGALGPGLHHGARPFEGQGREGALVLGGENHHLAPPHGRGRDTPQGPLLRVLRVRQHPQLRTQGGKAVLEDDDVEVLGGDLGLPPARARAQRALIGRGQIGAGLAMGGHGHPLPRQSVEAHLAVPGAGVQGPVVGDLLHRRGAAVGEEYGLPAVGEVVGAVRDQRCGGALGGGGRGHRTGSSRRSGTYWLRISRAAGSRPSSITTVSTSSRSAMR